MAKFLIKGIWFPNELYFSPSYQELTLSARNLFWFLLNELRWRGKGPNRVYINNGEVKLNSESFLNIFHYTKATLLKARNQLIEVGLIKITYQGGSFRGDSNMYQLQHEVPHPRWKNYPSKNWKDEIPVCPNNLVGQNTRWKKGQSGEGKKIHPSKRYCNYPSEVDSNDISYPYKSVPLKQIKKDSK